MSALEQALADYLQLRRSLGHELAQVGWLLPGLWPISTPTACPP